MTARTARWLALAATAAVACGVTAAPAGAHAYLVATLPPNESVVPTAPVVVRMVFSEPVDFGPHAIQLLNAEGKVLRTPPPTHAVGSRRTALLPVPRGLPNGTYVVAWRVVSDDSHPVTGGFSFSVGHPSAIVVAHAPSSSEAVGVADAIGRWIAFAALALTVGGAFLVLVLWPGGRDSRRARRLLWCGIGALLGSTLLLLLLQGPYGTAGSLSGLVDPSLLRFSLSTRFGHALVLRLALAAAFAVLVGLALYRRARGPVWAVAAAACALGLIATWTLTDHSSTGIQVWLGIPAASVHLLSMTLWLGGLAFLLACVLGRAGEEHASLAPVLPRFSRLGLACFAALGVTGLYLAWRQTGTLPALPATTFGQLLLVKSGLVLAIVALAALSRRAVAGYRSEPASVVRRLRRSVAGEALLGAAVLAVTAVLVNEVPARLGYTPPVNTTVPVRATGTALDGGKIQVLVKPATEGANVADIYLTAPDGTLFDAQAVRARLDPPGRAAPLPVAVAAAEPGHYVVSPLKVPYTGRWALHLVVTDPELQRAEIDVPVRIR